MKTPFAALAVAVAALTFSVGLTTSDPAAAPERPGVTPDLIGSAIAILDFNRAPADWTKAGKPKVAAIERVLGADIAAADRDGAWRAYENPPPAAAETVAVDAGLRAELAKAHSDLALKAGEVNAWRSRAEAAERRIDSAVSQAHRSKQRYDDALAGLEADRDIAATARAAAERDAAATRREAAAVLDEARARERGAGPPASRDCRTALRRVVIDADTGWFSGDVGVDEKGRAALANACLFSPER